MPPVQYYGDTMSSSHHGPSNGVPLNVILEDHATFSKVMAESKAKQRDQSLEDTASEASSLTTRSEHDADHTIKTARTLLDVANARLQIVEMEKMVSSLKIQVKTQKEKIANLSMALRRATASKCDLVVACNDIENQKLSLEEGYREEERAWKRLPLKEKEHWATMEQEYMNKLVMLERTIADSERRHKNQMLEKDFEIAQLQEQLRRVKEE